MRPKPPCVRKDVLSPLVIYPSRDIFPDTGANVHLHAAFSDGVFIEDAVGQLRLLRVDAPTLEDIRHIADKIARRAQRWL